jgi:hypothetical protein
MIHLIDNLRKIRGSVIEIIKDLSLEKLNKIPHGFNNNIIWNVGHIFAAQQNVCYVRIGLSPAIPLDTYSKFLPGTRPEQFIESDVKEDIVALMSTTLDLLERDCQKNVFENFTPWTTRSGFPINSINDALIYLHFHEGMHTGVIMSMKKLVQK